MERGEEEREEEEGEGERRGREEGERGGRREKGQREIERKREREGRYIEDPDNGMIVLHTCTQSIQYHYLRFVFSMVFML